MALVMTFQVSHRVLTCPSPNDVEVPAEQVGVSDVELVVFQRYEEDSNET